MKVRLSPGAPRTLDDIEARAPRMAFWSVATVWWTSDPDDLHHHPEAGLPCDPLGGMLMQGPFERFAEHARANPDHYGRHGLRALVAAHHGVAVLDTEPAQAATLKSWAEANDLLDGLAVDGTPPRARRAIDVRREEAAGAAELYRCLFCAGEHTASALTESRGLCPHCRAEGAKPPVSLDVDVRLNWLELQILVMWAERWAIHAGADEGEKGKMNDLVQTIAGRLQAQHPDRGSLTLQGQVAEIERAGLAKLVTPVFPRTPGIS